MSTTTADVDLPNDVQAPLETHAFSDTTREVGGVLIGELRADKTVITGFIPALRAASSATNVTFTHEVWADVLAKVDAEHAGERIVGWYHTHPGFGIFLSDYDKFIQRSFFDDPKMVALVVDPLAGEAGWFAWRDGEIGLVEEFPTMTAAVSRPDDRVGTAGSRGKHAGRLVLYAAALAIIAGATGYVVGGRTSPPPATTADQAETHETSVITEQQDLIAKQQARIAQLEERQQTSAAGMPPALKYRVRAGDSWWGLAELFYQDGGRYRELRRANTDRALDPGDVVIVPDVKVVYRKE